ncbi:hypothetical protein BMS3Abin03_02900 [bacterium BMS3Abin03]|nr:hypothetical protein BMS3Abin03_02900 [bacterium BMS3Abin03]
MTTLPPPNTREFPESSMEKKVYNIVESLSEYLPIANDRNRLGFGIYKYMTGEGDPPEVLIKSSKLKIKGITPEELAKKVSIEIENIK